MHFLFSVLEWATARNFENHTDKSCDAVRPRADGLVLAFGDQLKPPELPDVLLHPSVFRGLTPLSRSYSQLAALFCCSPRQIGRADARSP